MLGLRAGLDVDAACIEQCFFTNAAENKAGRIKKRGVVVRVNLGWMDRLFWGRSHSAADAGWGVDVKQQTPRLLCGAEQGCDDHALVAWEVAIRDGGGA